MGTPLMVVMAFPGFAIIGAIIAAVAITIDVKKRKEKKK